MTKHFPLASNQIDIYMEQMLHNNSPLYNIGGYFKFKGKIDKSILEQAIEILVNKNDALRIVLHQQNGIPVQKIGAKRQFSLEVIDFSKYADSPQKCLDLIQTEFSKPFSLLKEPLFKAFLVAASEQNYYVVHKYHHITSDGWTSMLVFKQMVEIYNALLLNQPEPFYTEYTYRHFLKDSQDYLNSNKFVDDGAFWQNYLPELPDPLFKTSNSSNQGELFISKIPYSDYNKLQVFSKYQQASIFHIMLSCLVLYLYRTQQKRQFVIGLPILNRKQNNKQTVGLFVKVVPFLINIEGNPRFIELLEKIKIDLKQVYRHQRYPLKEIVKNFDLYQQGRQIVFDVMFSYEKQIYDYDFINTVSAGGAVQVFSRHSPYPLAITLCEFHEHQDVDVIFEYDQSLFTNQEIVLLSERFQHILTIISSSPEILLDSINIITDKEKQLLLNGFNQTESPIFCQSIADLFELQADKTPYATALSFENNFLNYQQLNHYANSLAQTLINAGVRANTIVAVLLPRSFEMIVSLLAVLKSGAAYLPIDIESPLLRIEYLLQDTQAHLIISNKDHIQCLGKTTHFCILVDKPFEPQQQNPIRTNKPDDLSYIIYTSGSTGIPKGVLLTQAALFYRLNWMKQCLEINPSDAVLQVFQYCFDPSVHEIFVPLISGAKLILPSARRQSAENLISLALVEKPTIISLVPSLLDKFLESCHTFDGSPLRLVTCGGEALSPALTKRFFDRINGRLINFYGPTEATILATYYECTPEIAECQIPIGKPLFNTQVYVLNEQLSLLPIGVKGELYIGGNGIAKGYLNRPELDNERFIDNPFAAGKLYKTGDLVSFRHDGLLDFHGRLDRQVKLRGFRIELGEIEHALCQQADVKQAVVCLHTIDEKPQLNAYIISDKPIKNDLLRQSLNMQLPDYMLPQTFTYLNEFPLTANHKIDYQQLPLPDKNELSKSTVSALPKNSTESLLIYLWEKVLDTEPINNRDNFFDLGGDSFAALSIIVELESLMAQKLSISLIFEQPTISRLAEKLDELGLYSTHSSLLNLSFDQSKPAFFCIASGHGDIMRLANLAQNLAEHYTFYMLQPPLTENNQQDLNDLADEFVDKILMTALPPYRIAGFSIGGITALEVARKLNRLNHQIMPPILIDTIHPIAPKFVYGLFKLMSRHPQLIFWKRFKIHGRRQSVLYADRGLLTQLWAASNHHIENYPGAVCLITSTALQRFYKLFFQRWHGLIDGKIIHYICPGNHGSLFSKQHCTELSKLIQKCIKTPAV